MASRSADCVLGVVRLISSATMMLAKIGPGLNWNSCAAGLNTLERAIERARERLRQSSLADAGNVFDEQMAAREKGGERELDDVFLTFYDARNGLLKLGETRAGAGGGCLQFRWPSATKSVLQKVASW